MFVFLKSYFGPFRPFKWFLRLFIDYYLIFFLKIFLLQNMNQIVSIIHPYEDE